MVPTNRTGAAGHLAPGSRRVRGAGGARFDGSVLTLPEFLEAALQGAHPWIYRDHVPSELTLDSGTWVRVRAGKTEAWALWDSESPIALRVFSLGSKPDESWFRIRIHEAIALRRLALGPHTTAYRVLFGEGDSLPGITVDRYDRWAVIVTYARSLDGVVNMVAEILAAELELEGVLWRRSGAEPREPLRLLLGTHPPEDLTIVENGLRYYADLGIGQKTGLFLDQRDNRQTVARYAAGASMLNLFSYTGGFSVAAARAGARQVTSVDIAGPAIQRARDNFELNGLDSSQHAFLAEDCYEYLARAISEQQQFDLVVCDPPSLARNRAQLPNALRAYTLLNTRAMATVRVGGLYAAASCTAQVSPEAFRTMLADAARRAERRLQILHEVGHAPDHPHFAAHPEGRYLKFVMGRVLGRT
jgi:23S rRNA (cytosine1962-C5)-methyltransferase